MGINRFRLALDALINPNKNLFAEAIYKLVGGTTTTYNNDIDTLLVKGYGENPDVNAIVNKMASKSTAVPYIIKPVKDKKAYSKIKRYPTDPTFLQLKKLILLKADAFEDDEQPMPLDRPNPNQSWSEFRALYKIFLKVTGNVYIYRQSNLMGQPLGLYILPSNWMQIVLKPSTAYSVTESPIDYYIMNQNANYIRFDSETIIHIKRPNPFYNQSGSHLYGRSELMAAMRNINSSNSAIDQNVRTMQNSGVYGFLHAKDGQSPLTNEQGDSLKQRMIDMRSDSGFLSNIAGASAAIGFTRISLTTDELKPFEYLSNDRRVICNCLDWSIDLLNEEKTGTGFGVDAVTEAKRKAITDNIKPDLDLLADHLTREFIQKFKGYENSVLEFDISELPEMQTDTSKMIDWMVKAHLTPNEIREAVNYDRIEDENMDYVYINSNLKRIDDPSMDQMEYNK